MLYLDCTPAAFIVQGSTGQYRAAQGTRALRSQAPRALRCVRTVQRCAEKARAVPRFAGKARAVPRFAGKARGAARKRNNRGRNDRRRMEIVLLRAKTRDEPPKQLE